MTDRCPNCTGEHNCVRGNGPERNNYGTWIGEAPGWDENKNKIPFCGKTGREVNEGYMPLAGIQRPAVRVTNAMCCLPSTSKHKLDFTKQAHRDMVRGCAEWHLYPELERTNPNLLVPMGQFACHVIDPDINLELQHGIPLESKQWGTVFPMYHPAGGIHEPKRMLQIRTDWARLRRQLGGTLTVPTDKYQVLDYQECTTPAELDKYLGYDFTAAMAVDTETTRKHTPYCLTLSVRPGTARLIRAENKDTLNFLQEYLDYWEGVILFHNWLFDGEVVEEMGLRFPWKRLVDTMRRVFILGNLPQGLKALAYRELGMTMMDFDDLVTPYSKQLVLDYYAEMLCHDWSKPDEQLVRTDTGGWKMYKPHGIGTKLKVFWTTYGKNEEKDVFNQWTKNWGEHHKEVEGEIGEWPGKCITHAPFAEVLHYACRDADATLRLYPVLRRMERKVRKTVQEKWGEI